MVSLAQRIHTEGELWQVNETLAAAVRGLIGQRLAHIVSLQAGLLNAFLHHLHSLHAGVRVKVAVDAHDLSSYRRKTCQLKSSTIVVHLKFDHITPPGFWLLKNNLEHPQFAK